MTEERSVDEVLDWMKASDCPFDDAFFDSIRRAFKAQAESLRKNTKETASALEQMQARLRSERRQAREILHRITKDLSDEEVALLAKTYFLPLP